MTKGHRIKYLRELLGMSQIDVANAVKVSKQTLYKYENDIVTNIPSEKIEALASVLDTTPAYLMGWTDIIKDDPVSGYPVYADVADEPKQEVDRFYLAKSEMGMFPKRSVTVKVEKPDFMMGDTNILEIQEAKRLYEMYSQAPPEIQAAVETLLKATKSDS